MTNHEYDVVIVGAGVSGALLAFELASNGFHTCLLEAGPSFTHRQVYIDKFYSAAMKVPGSPWPHSKFADSPSVLDIGKQGTDTYLVQKGPLPFSSTYERLAGGTGNHWLGTAMRLLPNDFRLKSKYKVPHAEDWPISYAELESWYTKAEGTIGVSGDGEAWDGYLGATRSGPYPMPAIAQSYLDEQFVERVNGKRVGGKELHVMATPQARNSIGFQNRPPCMGNTSCVPICPIHAKWDPSIPLSRAVGEAWWPGGGFDDEKRVKTPATVLYQSVAHTVEIGSDDSVSGIRYRTWDMQEGRVTAKLYVLAAHAIEVPKLLLNSPWKGGQGPNGCVANSSGQVGMNLLDHICHVSLALTSDPVFPFRGPLATSGIGDFRDGIEREKRAAYRIEIGNEGWNWVTGAPFSDFESFVKNKSGLWGSALRTALDNRLTRQVRMAAELEALPSFEGHSNKVTLSDQVDALGIPKPEIHYDISEYTRKGFAEASETMRGIYAELGVEEVLDAADPKSPAVFDYEGKTYQYRGAGHIMGTYRMGDDSASSVADANCRSHDHPNLYLLGSGLFPSSGTANPTLTIIALALRAAEAIQKEI